MKKLLSIALVALVAISAQAAAISWSSAAISFDGSTMKNNTSVMGYLIALEGTSLDESYTLTEGFSASNIGTVIHTDSNGTNKGGKVAGTADITGYANGDAFALLLVYTVGKDTYFNLSSSVNVLEGLDPTDPTVAAEEWSDFTINGSTVAEKGTLKAGAGWTAVPEPASAMLALAGVAMLIRRRK